MQPSTYSHSNNAETNTTISKNTYTVQAQSLVIQKQCLLDGMLLNVRVLLLLRDAHAVGGGGGITY